MCNVARHKSWTEKESSGPEKPTRLYWSPSNNAKRRARIVKEEFHDSPLPFAFAILSKRSGLQVSPFPADHLRTSCAVSSVFLFPPQGDFCTWGRTGMTSMVIAWAWLQAESLKWNHLTRLFVRWHTSHEPLSGAQFILAPSHQNGLQSCGSQHGEGWGSGCAATSSVGVLRVLHCSMLF